MISGSNPAALPCLEHSSSSLVSDHLCLVGRRVWEVQQAALHDLRPWNSALQGHQSLWIRWKREGDQLQEHKLLPFTTQGARTPTTYNLQMAVAAVEWLWYGPDTESVLLYSCKSHRHWIWSDLVRKMVKGQNELFTMDMFTNGVSSVHQKISVYLSSSLLFSGKQKRMFFRYYPYSHCNNLNAIV